MCSDFTFMQYKYSDAQNRNGVTAINNFVDSVIFPTCFSDRILEA